MTTIAMLRSSLSAWCGLTVVEAGIKTARDLGMSLACIRAPSYTTKIVLTTLVVSISISSIAPRTDSVSLEMEKVFMISTERATWHTTWTTWRLLYPRNELVFRPVLRSISDNESVYVKSFYTANPVRALLFNHLYCFWKTYISSTINSGLTKIAITMK